MTVSLDIANSNVNRNITLAGTSIAIFTFLLFFLYPRYSSGEISPVLFQLTLAVIVSVIFSLVISLLCKHPYFDSWSRGRNFHLWRGRRVLVSRLHPSLVGAKLNSV